MPCSWAFVFYLLLVVVVIPATLQLESEYSVEDLTDCTGSVRDVSDCAGGDQHDTGSTYSWAYACCNGDGFRGECGYHTLGEFVQLIEVQAPWKITKVYIFYIIL